MYCAGHSSSQGESSGQKTAAILKVFSFRVTLVVSERCTNSKWPHKYMSYLLRTVTFAKMNHF